ncbi:MAG TPA: M42 family metallopeptidase [Trueperaceae bacterium]
MDLPATPLDYLMSCLLDLLNIPSPTGYTESAMAYVEGELSRLGLESRRTPKGALLWTVPGRDGPARTVTSHIDTLGAMVKEIKADGRLKLTAIGGYDWATVEGEYCRVHPDRENFITGTVVNTKQSSHVFGKELHDLKRDESNLEVRLDALVANEEDVRALGIHVGDFVSWDSRAVRTESGFLKGRHLDNKAAVAISLAASKAMLDAGRAPASNMHFFVSNYEEVGHGAAVGIPDDTRELLCVDMAAVGEGQTSDEQSVTLCVKDSSGPYDYGMNERLKSLATQAGIELKRDIYPHYSSDASAAWRAGGSYPAALIGPGVDASHAYERCHERALSATTRLLLAYCVCG